jgi:hypothetical protein
MENEQFRFNVNTVGRIKSAVGELPTSLSAELYAIVAIAQRCTSEKCKKPTLIFRLLTTEPLVPMLLHGSKKANMVRRSGCGQRALCQCSARITRKLLFIRHAEGVRGMNALRQKKRGPRTPSASRLNISFVAVEYRQGELPFVVGGFPRAV